jgi:hypothetical protein
VVDCFTPNVPFRKLAGSHTAMEMRIINDARALSVKSGIKNVPNILLFKSTAGHFLVVNK